MDLYGCNNYSSRLWNELKPKVDSSGRQEIVATEEIRFVNSGDVKREVIVA